MSEKQRKLVGKGMQHGVLVKHPDKTRDALFVKEYRHYDDGTVEPFFVQMDNVKRPFWITKPGYRNHKEKKEWEHMDRLQRYSTTETDLIKSIKNALNMPYFQGSRRMLFRNPYIYGLEVPLAGLIKHKYTRQWPEHIVKKAHVAALDIETDVVNNRDLYNPIMCSTSFKREIVVGVYKGFVKDFNDPEAAIRKRAKELLPEEFGEDGEWTLTVKLVDDYSSTAIECINWLHVQKPDWLSVWNLDFDYNYIVASMEREGYNPAMILSDPSVPVG